MPISILAAAAVDVPMRDVHQGVMHWKMALGSPRAICFRGLRVISFRKHSFRGQRGSGRGWGVASSECETQGGSFRASSPSVRATRLLASGT